MALMSSFTPTQIAAICNELFQQASGGKSLAPVSTANFVAVAQTALQIGADPMINAISQMLARTIFLSDLILKSSVNWKGMISSLETWSENYRLLIRILWKMTVSNWKWAEHGHVYRAKTCYCTD